MMVKLKAVLDFGNDTVRISLLEGDPPIPIRYHRPMKYQPPTKTKHVIKPNLSVFERNKRLAYEAIPAMEGLVAVIQT